LTNRAKRLTKTRAENGGGGRGRTLDTNDQTIAYAKVRANNGCLDDKENKSHFPHLSGGCQ
jgi:hypothetical protein